jgi:DNA-binding XRE family transcriptional regulator
VANSSRIASGYVYLFKADGGFYKIGMSKSPGTRLASFNALPFNIRLIHQIETDSRRRLEKILHATYAACRVAGEWFALSEADVEGLLGLQSVAWAEGGPPDEIGGRKVASEPSEFGSRLKELREVARMTQAELASAADLSLPTVSRFERGEREPEWTVLNRLADVLGVTCLDFRQAPKKKDVAPKGRPPKKKGQS